MAKGFRWLALVFLAGCAPSQAHADKAIGRVLWQDTADLDGDGRLDRIRLSEKQGRVVLTVGKASRPLPLQQDEVGEATVSVIDLDTKDRRKELLINQSWGIEDPPEFFTVAFYDGRRIRLQQLWDSGRVTIDGAGTLTLVHQECPGDDTEVTYRLRKHQLVEDGRKVIGTNPPDACAACPYVYVREDGELRYRGEILRNLHDPALAKKQSLRLGDASGPLLEVELHEDKDEVTFLDEIYLEVGGVRVDPVECEAAEPFCAADDVHALLRRGESLRLTFRVDELEGSVRLFAVGYYVPR